MNRLSGERSAYLRHAAHQKIDWYPWSDEAFDRAARENKPVFLSTGAVWCHWCHVMAKECFENGEIADILNNNFISIKLDRDERPDIDKRYQRAVAAMSNGGGWPLSVFLTPDKKAFFGGTYFPPEDSHGRPGFKNVLGTVNNFYLTKKEEVDNYTTRLAEFLKPEQAPAGEIEEGLIESAVAAIIAEHDPKNGGFGSSPKFPMSGAIEFLINRYFMTGDESIGFAIKKTLESMAKGGFHDQLSGGFHRYSVDASWTVPHFEKMADDNAWLLRNYLSAYSLFGDAYFRDVSAGIVNFFRNVLSSPEGGFYASQDADVTPDDEGGYFTWQDDDFKKALDDEEYRILSLNLLDERGATHHDESKKVLFVAMGPEEISGKTGIDLLGVIRIIERGRKKLLAYRDSRTAPFIDTTLYTSLNGMVITSFLQAFRVFGGNDIRDFALKSLHRIMREHYADRRLFHTPGVAAILDDFIFLIEALISSYEVTGDSSFLGSADELMESCTDRFWDKEGGGFFDTGDDVLGIRLKGVEDIPHPSANSVGIIQLLKLHHMTGKERYHKFAESALRSFVNSAGGMGVHAGYYSCAVDSYYNMIRLSVEADAESELASAAVMSFRPYTCIVYGADSGRVVPCLSTVCFEPIHTAEGLRQFLKRPNP